MSPKAVALAGVELKETQWAAITMAAYGLTDVQIAKELHFSPKYVGKLLQEAYPVMGIEARTQIASWFQAKLGRIPPIKEVPFGDVRFRIGKHILSAYVLAGDGDTNLSEEEFVFYYESQPFAFPSDIKGAYRGLFQEKIDETNYQHLLQWNSYVANVHSFMHIGDIHRMVFDLTPGCFHDYIAVNLNLDKKVLVDKDGNPISIRDKYLGSVPILRQMPIVVPLCTSLNIITSDDKAVFGHRLTQTIQDRNMYGGSASGFVEWPLEEKLDGFPAYDDWDPQCKSPNPFLTAVREAKEEAGIRITKEQVTYLGVAIDLRYYFVDIFGEICVDEPVDSVERRIRRDSFEHTKEHCDFDPKTVADHMKNRPWQPTPAMALIFSLIKRYGWDEVDKAFL
jgi:8-oxo-dGTP pyrophosphatase MutT (NUDIX family)